MTSNGFPQVCATAALVWGALALPSRAAASDRADDSGLKAGSLLVRGRLIASVPYEAQSEIAQIGGRLRTQASVLPDGDLTYFLTDHWAVGGEAGILRTKVAAEKTLVGDLDIGHVWSAPVMATAQYHFLPEQRLNPYVGAGVYASWYFGEKPAGGLVTSFKVPPQYGAILVAGIDYQISGRWYANAEIKQVFLAEQTYQSSSGAAARVSLNVLIAGVGIGYRF